jgi:hypothetical protein
MFSYIPLSRLYIPGNEHEKSCTKRKLKLSNKLQKQKSVEKNTRILILIYKISK